MNDELPSVADVRMRLAVAEFKALISERYPEAQFELLEGDDPEEVYLRVVVDVDDLGEVRALYRDRLVDLQVDEGLPLTLVSVRPVPRQRLQRRPAPLLPAMPPQLGEL
jgi:hypothetical protein